MKKVALFTALVMIVSVVITAIADAPAALAAPGKGKKTSAHPEPPSGGPGKKDSGSSAQAQTQVSISAEDAEAAALGVVGGTVARVELKYPKHGAEYKVVIVSGDYRYDVHVNASTGAVRDYKSHQITKVGPSASRSGAVASISADDAKTIAIESAGGGVVTDCNLDYKKHVGALVYHIHVALGQYEYCVELNADSGDVFKSEQRYKG